MTAGMMALVSVFGIVCYLWGYQNAHITVLDESERLGAFYVGKKIVVVKEVKEYKPADKGGAS